MKSTYLISTAVIFACMTYLSLSISLADRSQICLDDKKCSAINSSPSKNNSRWYSILGMYHELHEYAKEDASLVAGFLRAGFHDCVTARPENPDSGCNGSLKFELHHPANNRLDKVVKIIEDVRQRYNNISLADSIMIAYAVASQVSGVCFMVHDVVDLSTGRKDSTVGDFYDGDKLDLPNGAVRSWAAHLSFYQSKGFTASEMVASLVVGHSLGGFSEFVRNNNQELVPTGRVINFTETDPGVVNADYCGNLLVKDEIGVNLPRFNTIPSDDALISNEAAVGILKKLCEVNYGEGPSFSLSFDYNRKEMGDMFRNFSAKLQGLSGQLLLNKQIV